MARRIQTSRSGGIAARFALIGLVMFPLTNWTAKTVSPRARDDAFRAGRAEGWAHRLMRESELTRYGWVPRAAAADDVDTRLAEFGAAYVLLDAQRRVVSASRRLQIDNAALVRFGDQRFAEFPPLGRVRVVRVPLRVFGDTHNHFFLLHPERSSKDVPPAGSAFEPELMATRRPAPWAFFGVGSVLFAVCLLVAGHQLVGRRVQRLDQLVAVPIDVRQPVRRMALGGRDEIGRLAIRINAMRKRAHRRLIAMTEREDRRRDWLAQLSHDLRTPLAALHLRLENMAQSARHEEAKHDLARALQDCQRIQALANGFMDLAELEVTEDFAAEPVMPEELLEQAARVLRPIAEDARIRFSIRSLPQPTIYADGQRMLRALENIGRNAIRHAHSQVVLGVESRGKEMRFFVRDDGTGFPSLEAGVSTRYEDWLGRRQSTGLGLRIADRVAKAHGGRLLVRNSSDGALAVCAIEPTFLDDERMLDA